MRTSLTLFHYHFFLVSSPPLYALLRLCLASASPPSQLSTIVGDLRGDNCKRVGGGRERELSGTQFHYPSLHHPHLLDK